MFTEEVTRLCVCAHPLLCEVRREGENLRSLVFFDGAPASETYRERVKSCPGCGQRLGLLVLLGENQPG